MTIDPASASAVAAIFSALTAFLVFLIQRRTLLEAARPELMLIGWKRYPRGSGDGSHEVIAFSSIRNVGRGVAINIYVHSSAIEENRPTAFMGAVRLPLLAANDSEAVDGEITIWWNNVPGKDTGQQWLPINISIWCWDAQNRRHTTTYGLLAVPLSSNIGMSDPIAPGVAMGSRTTRVEAVWLLKAKTFFTRPLKLPKRR